MHIAGGSTDTITALQAARKITDAILVCKRGRSAVLFLKMLSLAGKTGSARRCAKSKCSMFSVPVMVSCPVSCQAGSGMNRWPAVRFMPISAGAGGLAARLCASYPSQVELRHMVEKGSAEFALRKDRQLSQIHWATTAREQVESLFAFAFDHRNQFVEMARPAP